MKVSLTNGLLFGGLVVAVVGVFLPFASLSLFGIDLADVPLPWKYKSIALALIAGSAALGWPALSASTVGKGRRIGLSFLTGLMIVAIAFAFNAVSEGNAVGGEDSLGIAGASPGSGLIIFAAALVAIIAGVARLWMQPSPVRTPPT